jgi:hypothetical protein
MRMLGRVAVREIFLDFVEIRGERCHARRLDDGLRGVN